MSAIVALPDPDPAKIKFTRDQVAAAVAPYPANEAQVVLWLYDLAVAEDWSIEELSSKVKVDATTISRIWSAKYSYPKEKIKGEKRFPHPRAGQLIPLKGFIDRIEKFRLIHAERKNVDRIPFTPTDASRAIWKICDEALISNSMGTIYGSSQIGKTEALLELDRRNRGTGDLARRRFIYVRIPSGANRQMVCEAIVIAFGKEPENWWAALRKQVFSLLNDDNCLLLDECNQIFETCNKKKGHDVNIIELIRDLYDYRKCGIVLCGDRGFQKALSKPGKHQDLLTKTVRRGELELCLPDAPTYKDICALAATIKLQPPTGQDRLIVREIAQKHGLGRLTKWLSRAARRAKTQGKQLTWKTFNEVIGFGEALRNGEISKGEEAL